MAQVWEKNKRAIRYGNHATTVDAVYCTTCSVDIAHPLFDQQCAMGGVRPDCPHRRDTALEVIRTEQSEASAARVIVPATSPPIVPIRQTIDMLLWCPSCHTQHVDERTQDWDNPPHRSHLCHVCGTIWRPADIATNGVKTIVTVGKADTWSNA